MTREEAALDSRTDLTCFVLMESTLTLSTKVTSEERRKAWKIMLMVIEVHKECIQALHRVHFVAKFSQYQHCKNFLHISLLSGAQLWTEC